MIDESIKNHLQNKVGTLDFKALLDFMEASGIEYRKIGLRGAIGLCTDYCVYLDFNKLTQLNDKIMYFVILHETAHYKRMQKMGGKDWVISNLSIKDFDAFCESIITEEIIADRFASYVYFLLNKELYPRKMTQQLDLEDNQPYYRGQLKGVFNVVKNNEENYKNMITNFLINERNN